jgi:2-dehydro-3-deoxy-L-rhamnonate dehydrogenase (NAD+)
MNRQHKTVLITGAAGDIGSATARALVEAGFNLVLTDRPSELAKLHSFAASLASDSGLKASVVACDVTDPSGVTSLFEELAATDFLPTYVFNNAGVQGSFGRLDKVSYEDIATVFNVNVLGAITVLKAWSEVMIQTGSTGACVNTASMAGVSGAPNMAAYSASKAAIIGLTKSVAKDLAPFGIRANSVSPAFIGPGAMWDRQVELQAQANSQYYSTDPTVVAQQMINMIPLRRFGSLAEVASVVSFLLSDAASYLTGINVEIAGGSA